MALRIRALVAWTIAVGAPECAYAADPDASLQTPGQYTLFDPTPAADLRDMDTDRPNRTDTPHTVDAGHIQIETGLADFSRQWGSDSGNITSFSTGQFNVRLGVTNALEFNVSLDSFDTQHIHGGGTASGIGDLTLGGKLNFWGDGGSDNDWASALAIKPQIKIPTAGSTLGDGHVDAYAEFPFMVNLPDGFHLGLQTVPGIVRNTRNTAYVGGLQNSVSIDRTVIGKADFYVEYWTQVMSGPGSQLQQTLDTGVTYPVTKNLVLDSGVFLGLNHASTSFEYLGGFSVRF